MFNEIKISIIEKNIYLKENKINKTYIINDNGKRPTNAKTKKIKPESNDNDKR